MYILQRFGDVEFDELEFFETRYEMEEAVVTAIGEHNKTVSQSDCMIAEFPEEYKFTDGYFEHVEWRLWDSNRAFVEEDRGSGEDHGEVVFIGIAPGSLEGDRTATTGSLVDLAPSDHFKDWPWMIVLELEPGEIQKLPKLSEIGDFRLSIRRLEDGRLYADMSNEPIDFPTMCAEVLRRTQMIVCFAGPDGSDFQNLYLWDAENYRRVTVKDLQPESEDESFVKYDITELLVPLSEGKYPDRQ